MMRHVVRMLMGVIVGALVGAAGLAISYSFNSAVRFEMTHDQPAPLSGFSPGEQQGTLTFAWTQAQAEVRLPELDRRSAWRCVVRARGARPPGVDAPRITVALDGVPAASVTGGAEFSDIVVDAPPQSRPGLRLSIVSTPTFSAPPDPRALGAQVDSVVCTPSGWVFPSRASLQSAASAGGLWGAGAVLAGLSLSVTIVGLVVVAGLQAQPLLSGAAPYTGFAALAPVLSAWFALALAAIARLVSRVRRGPLDAFAISAIALTAAIAYLRLLALLHPDKTVVDGFYHAHNFKNVLGGSYFFGQPSAGGVPFPYAVALYVFAAPWAALVAHTDATLLTLLKTVTVACDATAGGLLYWMIVRAWRQPWAGLLAILLYHCLPLSYGIQYNANLTNVFGQAAMLVTVALASTLLFERRRPLAIAAVAVVGAMAMLAHLEVLMVLPAVLVVQAALWWWAADPKTKRPTLAVVWGTTIALILAVGLYWGRVDRLGPIYSAMQQARSAAPAPSALGAPVPANAPSRGVLPNLTFAARSREAIESSIAGLGWPLIILAAVGTWSLRRRGWSSRLGLSIAALVICFAGMFLLAELLFAPSGVGYRRQALELVGRTLYAASPGLVILAALGATWLWRLGAWGRILAILAVGWAIDLGFLAWIHAFRQ